MRRQLKICEICTLFASIWSVSKPISHSGSVVSGYRKSNFGQICCQLIVMMVVSPCHFYFVFIKVWVWASRSIRVYPVGRPAAPQKALGTGSLNEFNCFALLFICSLFLFAHSLLENAKVKRPTNCCDCGWFNDGSIVATGAAQKKWRICPVSWTMARRF